MSALENNATNKRRTRCTTLNLIFFVLQMLLVVPYCFLSFTNVRARGINTYRAAQTREHFVNTIGKHSAIKFTGRRVSVMQSLNSTDISQPEKDVYNFFIEEYLSFHRRSRLSATRRLIFRPHGAGLGDRFSSLLFAYWAAVLSKRLLLVEWEYPFPLKLFLTNPQGSELFLNKRDRLELNKTKPEEIVVLRANRESLLTYEKVLASTKHVIIMHSNRVPGILSDAFLTRNAPSRLTAKEVHNLRGNPDFDRAVLHHVFKLNDYVKKEYWKVSSDMKLRAGLGKQGIKYAPRSANGMLVSFADKARPYIGVHARIGKGVGEFATGRFREVSLRMRTAAMCLASRAVRLAYMSGSPALPVFLATDTAEFREVFEGVVKKISHNRVDVLSGKWALIHLARLDGSNNETYSEDDEDWQAMKGSILDLVMLGHAEHIVALYSSFPRLALALGDAETLTELRNEICMREEDWR